MKIAIIGAGLSGCNLYSNLKKQNHDIVIFEKSRGTGGRLSTKYIDDKFIDHGTSSIETYNLFFKTFLDKKVNEQILRKIDNTYYPTNGINKLCSSLIDKEDLVKNCRIVKATYENNLWTLYDSQNKCYENFDFLVLTIPAPQILENSFDIDESVKKYLSKVSYQAMASIILYNNSKQEISLSDFKKSELFFKVVNNSEKYSYKNFQSYVLHLNKEFVQNNIHLSKDEMFKLIDDKIQNEFNINLNENFEIINHLWKYAFVKNKLKKEFILSESKSYGLCGDYFNCINLESSYLSSKKLSEKIISINK